MSTVVCAIGIISNALKILFNDEEIGRTVGMFAASASIFLNETIQAEHIDTE